MKPFRGKNSPYSIYIPLSRFTCSTPFNISRRRIFYCASTTSGICGYIKCVAWYQNVSKVLRVPIQARQPGKDGMTVSCPMSRYRFSLSELLGNKKNSFDDNSRQFNYSVAIFFLIIAKYKLMSR